MFFRSRGLESVTWVVGFLLLLAVFALPLFRRDDDSAPLGRFQLIGLTYLTIAITAGSLVSRQMSLLPTVSALRYTYVPKVLFLFCAVSVVHYVLTRSAASRRPVVVGLVAACILVPPVVYSNQFLFRRDPTSGVVLRQFLGDVTELEARAETCRLAYHVVMERGAWDISLTVGQPEARRIVAVSEQHRTAFVTSSRCE